MIARRVFPTLIFILLLAGCSDSRGRAKRALKRVDRVQLRKDVATFYKDIFAEHRKIIVTVNPQYWSFAFTELRPSKITAYIDGFAFCLESIGEIETGLYVVPAEMDVEPKSTATASFEKLADGIFWYSFKP